MTDEGGLARQLGDPGCQRMNAAPGDRIDQISTGSRRDETDHTDRTRAKRKTSTTYAGEIAITMRATSCRLEDSGFRSHPISPEMLAPLTSYASALRFPAAALIGDRRLHWNFPRSED